jgi:hypothetical protein
MMMVRGAWTSGSIQASGANHVLSRGTWRYDGELISAAEGNIRVRFDGDEVSLPTDGTDLMGEAMRRGMVRVGATVGRCPEFGVLVVETRQTAADRRADVRPVVPVRLADGHG